MLCGRNAEVEPARQRRKENSCFEFSQQLCLKSGEAAEPRTRRMTAQIPRGCQTSSRPVQRRGSVCDTPAARSQCRPNAKCGPTPRGPVGPWAPCHGRGGPQKNAYSVRSTCSGGAVALENRTCASRASLALIQRIARACVPTHVILSIHQLGALRTFAPHPIFAVQPIISEVRMAAWLMTFAMSLAGSRSRGRRAATRRSSDSERQPPRRAASASCSVARRVARDAKQHCHRVCCCTAVML